MKTRVKKPIKVASGTTHGEVKKHVNPNEFRENKVKQYLRELGMDVREYARETRIRFDMQLINKGLLTI
jgi:hypothetical protein